MLLLAAEAEAAVVCRLAGGGGTSSSDESSRISITSSGWGDGALIRFMSWLIVAGSRNLAKKALIRCVGRSGGSNSTDLAPGSKVRTSAASRFPAPGYALQKS